MRVDAAGFPSETVDIRNDMADGTLQAWLVHLAEGVRDGQRRQRLGDNESSRAELDIIDREGVLTDATVVIHGTGLERADFKRMRSAPASGAPGGLVDDTTPPYRIYPANLNHIQESGNPLAPPAFFDRWFSS